jgi:hypothetical protein
MVRTDLKEAIRSGQCRIADIPHSQQGSNRIQTEMGWVDVRDEQYLAGSKDILGTKA